MLVLVYIYPVNDGVDCFVHITRKSLMFLQEFPNLLNFNASSTQLTKNGIDCLIHGTRVKVNVLVQNLSIVILAVFLMYQIDYALSDFFKITRQLNFQDNYLHQSLLHFLGQFLIVFDEFVAVVRVQQLLQTIFCFLGAVQWKKHAHELVVVQETFPIQVKLSDQQLKLFL